MIDYKKLTYQETYAAAKETIMPMKSPSCTLLNRLYAIVDACKGYYWEEQGDLDLIGVFIFEQRQQGGADKDTMGICIPIENPKINKRGAVIGLSREMLLQEPQHFQEYIFLHELAHLTELEHNDAFQERFNGMIYGWFNRNSRKDGKTRRNEAKAHHWY